MIDNYAAHPGGVSICGSVEVPFHIVQGLVAIQIIRASYNYDPKQGFDF